MASNTKKKKKRPNPSFFNLDSFSSALADSLPSSTADLFRLLTVLSVAAAVAVTCHFISTSFHKPQKPFCDTAASDYDDILSDYCVPCPKNGVCYDGKLECDHGYRKQGMLCVEDGDISEGAKKLSKWAEVRVCEAYAQLLCSGIGKSWVSEDEIWNGSNEYEKMGGFGSVEAVYMLAKLRATENIRNLLETRQGNHGVEEFKCPELLVNHYKPFSCSVRHWIIKHALLLLSACALFVGCIFIAFRVYRRHQLSVRAEQLYDEVCEILEEKPSTSRSVGSETEPWVVASWLRDHLLSPKERKDPYLWKKVEDLVQEDSRVDQYPKVVKGESKVVWEWQVEGPLSSSGKNKKSQGSAPKLKDSTKTSNAQHWMYAAILRS